MTNDEKQSIIDLQGSPGFRVLEYLIQKKIDELDSVKGIDEKLDIATQALGRKKAVELLEGILRDIGFKPTVKKDNTYE